MPLLVILFIVSYGILTTLVFEQGQTIESQRSLIKEMLKDSTQLAALKDKMARDGEKRSQQQLQAPAATGANGATAKAAGKDTDNDKEKDKQKDAKHAGKSAHPMKAVPETPAADLEDVRRASHLI